MKLNNTCFRATGNQGKEWCWWIIKEWSLIVGTLKQPLFYVGYVRRWPKHFLTCFGPHLGTIRPLPSPQAVYLWRESLKLVNHQRTEPHILSYSIKASITLKSRCAVCCVYSVWSECPRAEYTLYVKPQLWDVLTCTNDHVQYEEHCIQQNQTKLCQDVSIHLSLGLKYLVYELVMNQQLTQIRH